MRKYVGDVIPGAALIRGDQQGGPSVQGIEDRIAPSKGEGIAARGTHDAETLPSDTGRCVVPATGERKDRRKEKEMDRRTQGTAYSAEYFHAPSFPSKWGISRFRST